MNHLGSVYVCEINSDVIVYYALLASVSGEYLCQIPKEWSSDQLLEIICLAHSLVDHGCMLFRDAQLLVTNMYRAGPALYSKGP